jgi:hypothetical protein
MLKSNFSSRKMHLLCLLRVALGHKTFFLGYTPTRILQERVTQVSIKGQSAKIAFLLSLLFPFSSELWTCLKVQVMRSVLNGLCSSGKFKGTKSQPLSLEGKCFLLSYRKTLKSEGFTEIQRWEPRRKLKIVPCHRKIWLFLYLFCRQIRFTWLYL